MTECEHEVLERKGFENYACKECGIELTTSSIGVMKMFTAINKRLDKLANQRTASKRVDVIPDDAESMGWVDQPDSKPSEEDAVLMDLSKVTILVVTEKAVLVTKEGMQKWVPLSQIAGAQEIKEGEYLFNLKLTEKGEGWIHKKGWDKLEVLKR